MIISYSIPSIYDKSLGAYYPSYIQMNILWFHVFYFKEKYSQEYTFVEAW